MSLKNLKSRSDQALATIPSAGDVEVKSNRPMTAPGAAVMMQPTIDALNERAKLAEAKVVELMQRLSAQPTDIALDVLVEVPGRRRKLTADEFEQLKENLRNNVMVHAISVIALGGGKYEIISGHNRVEAYRAIGRSSIRAIVLDIDALNADRSAFYANLLQTSLSDFHKYAGFRAERESTGESQKEIAERSGYSESVISTLFAFERLPPTALAIIERRPEAIGMNCVAELARLSGSGRSDRVVEAIELIIEGKASQTEGIKYASAQVKAPRMRWTGQPVKIRAGRLDFCQYLSRGNTLRIDFRTEEQRVEAEEVIARVLREVADRFKSTS